MSLFTVKSLYVWEVKKESTKNFQERIVLVQAKDAATAIKKAEKEAAQYCKHKFENIFHKEVTIRVLEFFDVHELDGEVESGQEIFSTSTLLTKKLTDKAILAKVIDLDQKIPHKDSEQLYDHFRFCHHEHDHH